MEKHLEDEVRDLIKAHHDQVNALVREVLRAAGVDVDGVELDLETGVDSERVRTAKAKMERLWGGENPYQMPPIVQMTFQGYRAVVDPRVVPVPNRSFRHVANLDKLGVCDKCGATFSKDTYTWSEPPCTEVFW